jgi:glycosyltransferase involved in cell wall biosynthesis
MKPVLFVTGHAPADRVPAFGALDEREDVLFGLFGGRAAHGPADGAGVDLVFPHRHVTQLEVYALAASGRFRAVIAGTGGRVALPAAWAGARRAGVPLLLWSSLWAHPRSAAHAASWVLLRRLYLRADAVVTYGPHVSAYVRARGATNVHIAPQAVDNAFWAQADTPRPEGWPTEGVVKVLFVGRPVWEKGLQVLLPAWRASGLAAPAAALVLVGVGSTPPWIPAGGAVVIKRGRRSHRVVLGSSVHARGPVDPSELRNFYGSADVLVMPSVPTSTFREPWGLVVNEAMNQRVPVIASDAVGAVAGGLVRHERNGLVVPAGDPDALAAAIRRLVDDPELRARLGAAGPEDVRAYTPQAWAEGMSGALASVGASRERC